MNLKFENHGQLKLNPIPSWKRDHGMPQQHSQALAAFLRSFNKPKPEFRCNVMGKNVAAASEPELRRRVETALRAQLKKELARIAGLKISL